MEEELRRPMMLIVVAEKDGPKQDEKMDLWIFHDLGHVLVHSLPLPPLG